MPAVATCWLGFLLAVTLAGFVGIGAAETSLWTSPATVHDSHPEHECPIDAPAAVVEKGVWDFGQVVVGQALTANFAIRNKGSRRLVLSDQSQCCGSFSPVIQIAPGETKQVEVSIPTTDRSLGTNQMAVQFETNDPANPLVVFTVQFRLNAPATLRAN